VFSADNKSVEPIKISAAQRINGPYRQIRRRGAGKLTKLDPDVETLSLETAIRTLQPSKNSGSAEYLISRSSKNRMLQGYRSGARQSAGFAVADQFDCGSAFLRVGETPVPLFIYS
jgi:hypothetical protein